MSSLINNAKRNVLPVVRLGPDSELEQSLPPGNKKYINNSLYDLYSTISELFILLKTLETSNLWVTTVSLYLH